MARTLSALRVKIGLKSNGKVEYPDFNALPFVVASGMDWSYLVDKQGLGWVYDATSGHADDSPGSPAGQQWGVLVVPEELANEAASTFPASCSRITEAELEAFWDNKAYAHLPEVDRDDQILASYEREARLIDDALVDVADEALRQKLESRKVSLRAEVKRALDPDDPTPGIKTNPRKRWADFKSKASVIIKDA